MYLNSSLQSQINYRYNLINSEKQKYIIFNKNVIKTAEINGKMKQHRPKKAMEKNKTIMKLKITLEFTTEHKHN